MAKAKATVFFCKECGYESAKWMGQCPGCREWNTLVEAPAQRAGTSGGRFGSAGGRGGGLVSGRFPAAGELRPKKLSEIETSGEARTSTGMEELDRVLGGGLVSGSLVLVGGDPASASRPCSSRSAGTWPGTAAGCSISPGRNP